MFLIVSQCHRHSTLFGKPLLHTPAACQHSQRYYYYHPAAYEYAHGQLSRASRAADLAAAAAAAALISACGLPAAV